MADMDEGCLENLNGKTLKGTILIAQIDLLRASSGTGLYLITSLMSLIHGAGDGACIAGVVFGLLAGILFAYDVYTIILVINSNK